MKRFKDLTELEIKDLSEIDLIGFVKLECAEKGIAFVDKPLKPELAKDIEEDVKFFKIDGYPSVYVEFEKEEDARKVSDLLNDIAVVGKSKDFYSVKPVMRRSDKASILQKQVESVNNKIKSDYQAAMSEYEEYKEKWDAEYNPIREKYDSVVAKYSRLDDIKRRYNENYLPLSGGDEQIAKRFLLAAYPLSDTEEDYVFNSDPGKKE